MAESGGGRDGRHYRQMNDGEVKTQKTLGTHSNTRETTSYRSGIKTPRGNENQHVENQKKKGQTSSDIIIFHKDLLFQILDL